MKRTYETDIGIIVIDGKKLTLDGKFFYLPLVYLDLSDKLIVNKVIDLQRRGLKQLTRGTIYA
jgi:hypothetical protein